jgi:hypothetical protein
MRLHKAFCIAALLLIVASLLLVATDGLWAHGAQHRAGNCPVCTWASSLAIAQVPPAVTWIESTLRCWTPPESTPVSCWEFLWRPFSARSPPVADQA